MRDSLVNKGSGHIDTLGERLLSALFDCGSAALRYSLCSFNLETLEQPWSTPLLDSSAAKPWMQDTCRAGGWRPWTVSSRTFAVEGLGKG